MTKGNLIGWGIAVAIALGIGGFFGIRAMVRSSKVKPFEAQIDSYLQGVQGGQFPGEKNVLDGPPLIAGPPKPVAGKLIPVDIVKREVDYVYFDLPDDLRPGTPDEVGTVVLLRWGKAQVGQYQNNKPGYKQTCFIGVRDKATGEMLATHTVAGSEPPQSIKSSQSEGVGSKPTDEIVAFLKSLPRK